MVRLLPLTFALSLLLLGISSAASPPCFPWGTEITATFTDQSTGLALGGSRIELAFEGQQIPATAVRTLENGSAAIYLQQAGAPIRATASLDEPGTPELDYLSAESELGNGTNVEMVPVGTVSGTVRAGNGTAMQAGVSFDCANKALQAPAVTAGADGRFTAVLPAGQCTLTASAQGASGTATVAVQKGQPSLVGIAIAPQGGQISLPSSPGIQFASFLVALALIVAAAFIAYYLLSRRQPVKRQRKKGGRLRLLLLLAAFASASQAASLSNNVPASNHTYDFLGSLGYVPAISSLAVSGATGSAGGCAGTVLVEISDNGQAYAAIGSAQTVSPQNFTLSFPNPGSHRYIRIRNEECGLAATMLQVSEKPDITISSLRIGGEPKTGVPINLTATVYNAGGRLPSGQQSAIILRFYDSAVDQQHLIGEMQIGSSEGAWEERGSTEKSMVWVPPVLGTRTIYATASLSPESPGLEADERNNGASLGIFVQAGPGENRVASLNVSASPAALDSGQSSAIRITATYLDFLTTQPILGANCTASEEGQPGAQAMQGSGTGYYWEIASQQRGIGVYSFSASCEKGGYASASGAAYLTVNSLGGTKVSIRQEDGAFTGSMLARRGAFGQIQKLKVRVERAGPESVGFFGTGSVTINGYSADSVDSDAQVRTGRYWLEPGSTFVEWTFEMNRISGDSLTIEFKPELEGANATAISVTLTPVRSICMRSKPSVELSPQSRSGEVGTPLFYQVVVRNNDAKECPATEFELLSSEGRAGWRLSFLSSHLFVQPGKSNTTFISAEAPLGEQPGSYKFKVQASDPAAHSSTMLGEPMLAEATQNITSPKLFAGLEAGLLGSSTMAAGPGAVFDFYAHYYNITNGSIGGCSIASDAIGTRDVTMGSNGTHFLLALNLSDRSPGTYRYVIGCEAPEHKPLTLMGNITLTATASQARYPSLTIAPLAQHSSGNSTVAFVMRTANAEACNGSRQFRLLAQPPEGWAAELEGNAPSIGCGAEAQSVLHLTPPAALQRSIYFIPISAAYSDNADYSANAYALVASSQSQPRVLSCIHGDAEESAQNTELSGNPCWNWNAAQTYQLSATGGEITFAGRTAGENCSSTVLIEASTDSATFAKVAEVRAASSSDFTVTVNNTNYVRVRVSDDKCRLARTALMYGPPASGSPELSVAGADFPALVQGSGAVVRAVIRNAGQSTYASYTAGIALKTQDGDTIPLSFKTIYSHAVASDQEVAFDFTPPSSGIFDLVIAADYANEVNESDESDNSLVIAGVVIMPAPGAIRTSASPGWNLIPFISGIAPSHSCNLSDAFAYDAKTGSSIRLDPATLAFTSDADADSFAAAHGAVSAPRDAGAFGGAWAYSYNSCELSYSLGNASSQSRQSFSQLEVPQGASLVTVLPWMAGSTPLSVMGACGSDIWEWDSAAQRWARRDASTVFSSDDVGKVLLLRAGSACRIG